MDFVKRFRGKGAGRLGLGLATVVAWHRPPIGRGRHRNGLLNTIVLWTEIASGHRCAGLGAEVSRRYLSFGWVRLSFIGLRTCTGLSRLFPIAMRSLVWNHRQSGGT